MGNHHLRFRIGITFIFLFSLLSVVLFPVAAKSQTTFSLLKQNKEATLAKYQYDWSNTTIQHVSNAKQEYVYGEQIAKITIPKMDIYEYPVYYGSDPVNNNWQITAPGHIGNWAMFGEAGVSCVGAHNYQLFKNLKKLKRGDKILVETKIDRYVYVVDKFAIYNHKEQDWTTIATKHRQPYALNLMTCYPFDAIKTKDMYIVYTSLQTGTVFD